MVRVGRAREFKVGQHEGSTERRDRFFGGGGSAPEAASQVTGKAVGGACPVNEFVCDCAGVAFGRVECAPRRHPDRVGVRDVAGAGAAGVDGGARGCDEGVEDGFRGGPWSCRCGRLGRGVDLGDVEHGRGAGDEAGGGGVVVGAGPVRCVGSIGGRQVLVEQDQGPAFTATNLRAECRPLAVGRTAGVGVAVSLRRAPQRQGVEAPVVLARERVARQRVGAVLGGRSGIGGFGVELLQDGGSDARVQVGGHGRVGSVAAATKGATS